MSESQSVGMDYLLQTFRKATFFLIGQTFAISLTSLCKFLFATFE